MKPELEAEIRSFFPTPHKAMGYLATVDSRNGFTPEIRPMTLMEFWLMEKVPSTVKSPAIWVEDRVVCPNTLKLSWIWAE